MLLVVILLWFLVLIITIAIGLLIAYFSMHLTRKVFGLYNVTSLWIWRIIIYTSLVMLIPIIGIIWAIYIFYTIINENLPSTISLKKSIIAFSFYFIVSWIISTLLVFSFRSYLVTPFQVSGDSMETSYHHKEFILVNKFSYADFWAFRIGDPDRGDVVILRPHAANGKEYYIKRVVGMPGDTIKFENGEVLIKTPGRTEFVKIDEDYLSAVTKGKTFLPMDIKETEFAVPDGQYFTMGDNRSNSSDSRSCFMSCTIPNSAHFVSRSNIIGKLFIDFGYVNIFGADGIIRTGEFKWTHPPRFLSTPKDWIYTEL